MQEKAPARGQASTRRVAATARPSTTAGARSRLALPPLRAAPVTARPANLPRTAPAKTVGSFIPRLTRPAFERYGFSAAALITDWATIVGEETARYTMPERLKWPKRVDWSGDEVSEAERGRPGATLILGVTSGRALDIEYKSAQLIERINSYFGYRAVATIRITQVAAIRPTSSGAASVGAGTQAAAAARPRAELQDIAAPSLRAALERMAQGLGARKARGRATA